MKSFLPGAILTLIFLFGCKKAETASPDDMVAASDPEPEPEPEPNLDLRDSGPGNTSEGGRDSDDRDLFCLVIHAKEYCSNGGDKSIVELPTGDVLCAPGPCERLGGKFLCAPKPGGTVGKRPGSTNKLECLDTRGNKVFCVTPTARQCVKAR